MTLSQFDRSACVPQPLDYLREHSEIAQTFGFFMMGPPEDGVASYALLDQYSSSHLYAQHNLQTNALDVLELTVPEWLQKGRLGSLLGHTMLTEAIARDAVTLTAFRCTVGHGLTVQKLMGWGNYDMVNSPGKPWLCDISADLTKPALLDKLESFLPPITHPVNFRDPTPR